MAIVEESKGNAFIEKASSNAATILSAIKVPFSGLNLQKARIPGADLTCAVLDRTDLSQAVMKNIILQNAFLKDTNLTNADMEGVEFGERPYLEGHRDRITSVCFSPDGSLIASGSWDKTIRIWKVDNGKSISILEGHVDGVRSVCFSPDGSLIASGGGDHSLKVWDMKTMTLIWTSNPRLYCKGMKIKGARGISDINRRLLLQRGGITYRFLSFFRYASILIVHFIQKLIQP